MTYEAWHEGIKAGTESAYLDPDEGRRFPEPRRWRKPTSPVLAPLGRIDVCVAVDLTTSDGAGLGLPIVRAALSRNLAVAVTHLDDPRSMKRRATGLLDPWSQLVGGGAVEWIQADDRVEVEHLYVPDPGLLQYPPTLRRSLRASQVFLNPGHEADGPDHYCGHQVVQRAAELFGTAPVWLDQPVDRTLETLAAAANPPGDLATAQFGEAVVSLSGCTGPTRSGLCVDLDPSMQSTVSTCRVPLRSQADAESHDELCVVFRTENQQDATRWLRRLADAPLPDPQAAALFGTAPATVPVVLLTHEGAVQLLSRLPLHLEQSAHADRRATTPVTAPGWESVVWLASQPHRVSLTLP